MIRLIYPCFLVASVLVAQGPPPTTIHLADFNETSWALSTPAKISTLPGYNNQPSFLSDGTLLFTANVDGQTDIFHYSPKTGASKRLTWSQESEYSPTLMPDGTRFSVIRVEHDGIQRLWAFPLEGGPGEILLPHVKPVGYHLWLSRSHLALFVLGEPNYLAEVISGQSAPKRVLSKVGRCLLQIPGQSAYSVVQKTSETDWAVKRVDLDSGEISTLTATLPGSEDYAWTPSGSLLMAQGQILYRFKPGEDKNWVQLADLGRSGLQKITRLALSSDGKQIALVSAK